LSRCRPRRPLPSPFPYTTLFRSAQESSSLGASAAGVFSTGVLHTAAIGEANATATEASVADLNVVTSGFFFAGGSITAGFVMSRSEEHTSELQSLRHLVCRLLLE